MKIKVTILFSVILLAFTGFVIFQVDSKSNQERENWLSSLASEQVKHVSGMIQADIAELKSKISNINLQNFKNEKPDWNRFNQLLAVAMLGVDENGMALHQVYFRDEVSADVETEAYLSQQFQEALKAIRPAQLREQSVFFTDIKDRNNLFLALMIQAVGNQYVAAIVNDTRWQQYVSHQKQSDYETVVVNQNGRVLIHSSSEYVGSHVGSNPMFEEIKKQVLSSKGKYYASGSGISFFGKHEQIEGSNLYVLFRANEAVYKKSAESSLMKIGILGLGSLLIGLALLIWLFSTTEELESIPVPPIGATGAPLPIVTPVPAAVVVKPNSNMAAAESSSILQEQKLLAYRRIAQAFALEMKAPVYAILSQAQMMSEQLSNEKDKKSAEHILKESRKIKDMVDKVFKFSGDGAYSKSKASISDALEAALKNLDIKLKQKNIKVLKNISQVPSFEFVKESVEKAIEALICNSMDALERMQNKEIKINIFENSGNIVVEVEDNGEGIEESNLSEVINPFFTTRSYSNHIGLGLTLVHSIVADHGGELKIESQRGKGTKVTLLMPEHPILPNIEIRKDLTSSPNISLQIPPLPKESEITMPELNGPVESALNKNVDEMLEFPEIEPVVQSAGGSQDLQMSSSELIEATSLPKPILGDLQVKVIPPQFEASSKKSELDEYKFEIRRPEKRV